jgi:hypothetical protein
MVNSIERVRELANREHEAEQGKASADEAWRTAWWELTLELASIEDRGSQVIEAKRAAADSLGQSVERMGRRRSAGRKVDHMGAGPYVINMVPPELAMEWTHAGRPLDGQAIPYLANYEGSKRDLLREMAAEDGVEVRAGQRTAQDYAEPQTVEERAERVRKDLADPNVRSEVARQHVNETRERISSHGLYDMPPAPEFEETKGYLAALGLTSQARWMLRKSADSLADFALSDEQRSALSDRADSLDRALEAFRQVIATGDVDDALRRLLAEEDAR